MVLSSLSLVVYYHHPLLINYHDLLITWKVRKGTAHSAIPGFMGMICPQFSTESASHIYITQYVCMHPSRNMGVWVHNRLLHAMPTTRYMVNNDLCTQAKPRSMTCCSWDMLDCNSFATFHYLHNIYKYIHTYIHIH